MCNLMSPYVYSRSASNYIFLSKYQSRSKPHHHITDIIGIVSNEDKLRNDYDYVYGDDYEKRNRTSSLQGVIMIICSGLFCISIIGMIINFIYNHGFAERNISWVKNESINNDESRKLKSQA